MQDTFHELRRRPGPGRCPDLFPDGGAARVVHDRRW